MRPRVDEALFLSRADDVTGDLAIDASLLHLLEELLHERSEERRVGKEC